MHVWVSILRCIFVPIFKFKLDNHESLRHVLILKKAQHLALSGDLVGDLKVWNLNNGHMEYEVAFPGHHQGLFRVFGSVDALSQNLDIVACAFSNRRVALFSTFQCLEQLEPLQIIDIECYIDKISFIRSIHVSDGQLFVCNVSSKVGIVMLSIWE